jgi:hypothetical protein
MDDWLTNPTQAGMRLESAGCAAFVKFRLTGLKYFLNSIFEIFITVLKSVKTTSKK